MIQMAYRVAVKPELFSNLIDTWDHFIESVEDEETAAVLRGHFEQAERIVSDPRLDRMRNLDAILQLVAAPAILVDEDASLVAGNEAGLSIVGVEPGAQVSPLLDHDWRPADPNEPQYFRVVFGGAALLAASTNVPVSQDGTSVVLIRLEASQWSDALHETLLSTYDLTPAEIETTQHLHEGRSLSQIADIRARSLETVRSQLKSILRKTGSARQAALLQLLSRLQYVVGSAQSTGQVAGGAQDRSEFARHETRAADGRRLIYSIYGAPDGREVLYLTTSSRPEETADWRRAASQNNLRIIALHRPGFGGSAPVAARSPSVATLTGDILHSLPRRHPGSPLVVAGHREGGILAAQITPHLREAHDIRGVCLISTGVPQAEFNDDPSGVGAMKRSVRAVRLFPHALRLGYRAAKRVFEMSVRGEAEIIAYFVKSNPLDQQLIRDPVYREITRENIAYSFEDSDAIVDDIALWSSDWSADLPIDADLRSIHILGAEHDFLEAGQLTAYCDRHPGHIAVIVPRTAQMMLYQRPDLVAQHMASLLPT